MGERVSAAAPRSCRTIEKPTAVQGNVDASGHELLQTLYDVRVLAEVDGLNARLLRSEVESVGHIVDANDPLRSENLRPLDHALANRSKTLEDTQ